MESLHPLLQILHIQLLSLRAVPCRSLCHGADPLNVPDELGLQVRTSALTHLPVVVRKQVFFSKCSATVSVGEDLRPRPSSTAGPHPLRQCERKEGASLNVSVDKRFYKKKHEEHESISRIRKLSLPKASAALRLMLWASGGRPHGKNR